MDVALNLIGAVLGASNHEGFNIDICNFVLGVKICNCFFLPFLALIEFYG